ncbi:MAG: hypothetical protein LH619_07585 [Chitinophagaceae bacterium]|nr:hypothetical protein [Chitinophagaceae bacterium]
MADILPVAIPLQFKMKGVELLKSQINQPAANFSATEFKFNINIETKLDPVQKLIFVITTAEVKADDNQELLGVISSACIFGIDNFDEVFKKVSEDKYHIPDDVMLVFISISLSTLRGIMFEHFRGTYLHTAFLPVIDPKQFKLEQK